MVSKKIIADLIIAQKSGGFATSQSKIDERDVFALVDIAVGALVDAEYRQNLAKGSYSINNSWISTYPEVQIYFSEVRKEKYVTLPVKPIELPGDRCIRLVCPTEDQSDMFVLVDNNAQGIFKELEAGNLSGLKVCYLEGDRIYFPGLTRNISKVMVKMLAGTDGLDENAPIPIPAITQKMLYEQVSALLETQVKYRTKMVSDSNPNTA
jgi:hypothetical protein